jgi:hypothetical protein
MVREIQPDARFIITLSDPIQRMYSDYYFLEDNLRPVRRGGGTSKSATQFGERAAKQVRDFEACIVRTQTQIVQDLKFRSIDPTNYESTNRTDPFWFRSAQM